MMTRERHEVYYTNEEACQDGLDGERTTHQAQKYDR